MASSSAAKKKGFIFFTDHYPGLLLIDPTCQSEPSWPISGVVYSLSNAIICVHPPVAVTKKSAMGTAGVLQARMDDCSRSEGGGRKQQGLFLGE